MDEHEEHRRICQEKEIMKAMRPGPADSPPPNCAICLGTCTNKCFTDCCLHQFCFSCLLEWSKIKAECPLCKQHFKSIIYNIKSNSEYEEHIITNPERDVSPDLLLDTDEVHTEFLFLPNGPRPQRHFQFRTTLTLDPGGELAIQQLLLSHPRTNSLYLPADRYHRVTQQTLNFRRSVYHNDLWVESTPDVTGRYRECSPNFFRENPAQTHRVIPWLNRELTALLNGYAQTYTVQDRIVDMLPQYPIQSAAFRTNLIDHLGTRTDHFIHEFYNFARSPYDMIGYDRNVRYTHRPPVIYSESLSDDDSDVRVVDSPNDCIYVPPLTPEVIVINSDSDSDSDLIIERAQASTTPPIVLVDSDSDENENVNQTTTPETEQRETRSPQLPIKIRLKLNRHNLEMCKNYKRKDRKNRSRDTSESDAESNHPKSESEYSTAHISTSSNYSSESDVSYSTDWTPIKSEHKYTQPLVLKRKKCGRTRKRKESKSHKSSKHRSRKLSEEKLPKKRSYKKLKKSKRKSSDSYKSKREKRIKLERPLSSHSDSYSSSDSEIDEEKNTTVKTETEETIENGPWSATRSADMSNPGPSRVPTIRSVIVKGNKWYSRPDLFESSTDDNSN